MAAEPRRHRRLGGQRRAPRHGVGRPGDRGPLGQVRPVPEEGRRDRLDPRRPGPRRADRREGRGAAGRPVVGPGARYRSRDRARRAGQGRPLRALRPAGRARRGRPQAPHVVAVRVDVPGHPHVRPGARAAADPPGGRHRSRIGRGDRRLQRQVRPLPEEGDRLPQPAVRGPAPDGDGGRGRGPVRPAQDPGPQRQGPAARAGPRPRHRPAHGGQGRSLRPLRHRRDHQRLAAPGRRRRGADRRAGRRAARRAAGGRAVAKKKAAKKKAPAKKKAAAKKATGQEGGGQEGRGQEGGGEEGRPPRRRPAASAPSRAPTTTGDRPPGPPHRPGGDRRLREVHPGPAPGRPPGRGGHLRARRHRRSARRCAPSCSTGTAARWRPGPRRC